MKSYSNDRPSTFVDLLNGHTHYNHNVVEEERPADINGGESTGKQFVYDTTDVVGELTYSKIVAATIADKYSIEEELELTGKYNDVMLELSNNEDDVEEYKAYRRDVAAIKAMVRADCQQNGILID